MGDANDGPALDDLGSGDIKFLIAAGGFLIFGGVCLARGLHKLRRSKELELDAQFRRIAHQIRWVGGFLILSAVGCGVASFAVVRYLLRTGGTRDYFVGGWTTVP